VTRVIYAPAAFRDLERLVDFLLADDRPRALEIVELMSGAIEMLAAHPLVGRATPEHLRELVISRGKTGYLALYDYDPRSDTVLLLAIRHQREAGYSDPADVE
jgi:plasmid stabilization system protein ParE